MALSIALGTLNHQSCSLKVIHFTDTTVSLKYDTLPANQPCSYSNTVMIWEASWIPWTVAPLQSEKIPQNGQSGDVIIGGLDITRNAYIVGYAVGDEVTDICATAHIAAGALATPLANVHIWVSKIETDSLTVNYHTLPGYLPKTYKNWIGLWEGWASPFNAPQAAIDRKDSKRFECGKYSFKKLALSPGTPCTLVYFMGPEVGLGWSRTLTNAAAVLYLRTAPQGFQGVAATAAATIKFSS